MAFFTNFKTSNTIPGNNNNDLILSMEGFECRFYFLEEDILYLKMAGYLREDHLVFLIGTINQIFESAIIKAPGHIRILDLSEFKGGELRAKRRYLLETKKQFTSFGRPVLYVIIGASPVTTSIVALFRHFAGWPLLFTKSQKNALLAIYKLKQGNQPAKKAVIGSDPVFQCKGSISPAFERYDNTQFWHMDFFGRTTIAQKETFLSAANPFSDVSHARSILKKEKDALAEEYRQTKQKLQKMEAEIRPIIQNNIDVHSIITPLGITLHMSSACRGIYGWRPEDLKHQNIFSFFHAENADAVKHLCNDVFKSPGRVGTIESKLKHKNGSWCEVSLSAFKLLDNSAEDSILLTFHDISRKKAVELQLDKFKCFLEELAAERKARLAQTVEKTLVDFSKRERVEKLLLAFNRVSCGLENTKTPTQVFKVVSDSLCKLDITTMILSINKDGDSLFPAFEVHGNRLQKAFRRISNLKPKQFSIPLKRVPLLMDVLEKRETRFVQDTRRLFLETVIGSEGNFRKVRAGFLKNIRSIFIPFVIEGRTIGVICFFSTHLTEQDVATFNAFCHQTASAWRKTELVQQYQIRQQRLEKQFDSRVSEIMKFQEQFYHVQQLEAIGQLAGGVAHDFNNILGGITNYIKLIVMKAETPKKVEDYAKKVSQLVAKSSKLTHQLLAFARKINIKFRPFDIHQSIVQTVNALGNSMDKRIAIESRLEAENAVLKGDASLIESVLRNLTINAVDAMAEGGCLIFETACCELNKKSLATHGINATPGNYVEISVSDTGSGMDDNVRKRIFQPFFTTKELDKGTGLGLASVYGIVKQHNGYITVESQPGKGSTFRLYLPAMTKSA